MSKMFAVLALALCSITTPGGPWEMQDSHSTAGLRGVHAVNGNVAWASGTGGTILRTVDGGVKWRGCATPPGAERLDFRGVWAWDADHAIVMSSGSGELSRLFSTADGCAHWTEVIRNSEKDGSWDSAVFQSQDFGMLGDNRTGVLIGDPVDGRFETKVMILGRGWFVDDAACRAAEGESAFAASNSSVFVFGSRRYAVGTGGRGGPRVLLSPLLASRDSSKGCLEVPIPLAGACESCGVFSLAFRDADHGVAVGGDYRKPGETSGTAAWTADGGRHWTAASKLPHGFRSAVAWHAEARAWIAAGTNGSDISRDDGRTWLPLDDDNWNAISLPFIVGPNGRIGKLENRAIER